MHEVLPGNQAESLSSTGPLDYTQEYLRDESTRVTVSRTYPIRPSGTLTVVLTVTETFLLNEELANKYINIAVESLLRRDGWEHV
jgi:hypothetical protein